MNFRTFGLWSLLAVAFGCASPTQVVVSVDALRCDVENVRVTVTGSSDQNVEIPLEDLPATVAVSGSGSFDLRVTGLGEDGAEVANASGSVSFSEGEIRGLHVVLTDDCGSGCAIEGTTAFTEEPGPVTRDCDNPPPPPPTETFTRYDVSSATFDPFTNACEAGAQVRNEAPILPNGADAEEQLVLPEGFLDGFDFTFFGEELGGLWVSDDGVLTFGTSAPDASGLVTPGPLSEPLTPRPSVMAFWNDNRLRAEGICWGVFGTAPNRSLIITWADACTAACADEDHLDISIVLEETTGRIVLTYDRMVSANEAVARGQFATVGVVSSETACSASSCGMDGMCEDGVTPCGFTQLFAQTAQADGVSNVQFVPVEVTREIEE